MAAEYRGHQWNDSDSAEEAMDGLAPAKSPFSPRRLLAAAAKFSPTRAKWWRKEETPWEQLLPSNPASFNEGHEDDQPGVEQEAEAPVSIDVAPPDAAYLQSAFPMLPFSVVQEVCSVCSSDDEACEKLIEMCWCDTQEEPN